MFYDQSKLNLKGSNYEICKKMCKFDTKQSLISKYM